MKVEQSGSRMGLQGLFAHRRPVFGPTVGSPLDELAALEASKETAVALLMDIQKNWKTAQVHAKKNFREIRQKAGDSVAMPDLEGARPLAEDWPTLQLPWKHTRELPYVQELERNLEVVNRNLREFGQMAGSAARMDQEGLEDWPKLPNLSFGLKKAPTVKIPGRGFAKKRPQTQGSRRHWGLDLSEADQPGMPLFRKLKEKGRALSSNNLQGAFEDFISRIETLEKKAVMRRSRSESELGDARRPWQERGLGGSREEGDLTFRVQPLEEWDLFKKVKKKLNEFELSAVQSIREIQDESRAMTNECFEDLKKNVQSLAITAPPPLRKKRKASTAAKRKEGPRGLDVPALEPSEVLESLVREAEPILEQLGVSNAKGKTDKVCGMLRQWRKKQRVLSPVSFASGAEPPETASTEDEPIDKRLASVTESTGYNWKGGLWEERRKSGLKTSTSALSMKDENQKIAVVTTAALPWMTGTSINPLLRAAFLAKANKQVTLVVPWLSKADQELVYPNKLKFETPAEQEVYVRDWLEQRVGFKTNFKIRFYPGRYSTEKRSILAVGDITEFIPDGESQVAVLEEPEHLSWYHHGKSWTDKFDHVVGIVHTNYLEYVKREENGEALAFLLKHINNWVARCYCNRVIRLSGATQDFPKSTICNVHGVSPKFLEIGERFSSAEQAGKPAFSRGAYFLGKMVWGKGYRELVDLLGKHNEELNGLKLDVFGNGDDQESVWSEAKKRNLPVTFFKGRDHADKMLQNYKVFINPSMSDVVATTTAEALAMGKIVVCAEHPSNEFFAQNFPNCWTYRNEEEFVEKVKAAMHSDPLPMTPEQRHLLSWEAATERFLEAAEPIVDPAASVGRQMARLPGTLSLAGLGGSNVTWEKLQDKGLAWLHSSGNGLEFLRRIGGGLPNTMKCTPEQYRELGVDPYQLMQPVYGL